MKNYVVLCLAFASCFIFSQNIEVKYYGNVSVDKKVLAQLSPGSETMYLPNTFSYTLVCNGEASLYKNDNFDDDFYTRTGIKKKYFVHDEKVVKTDERGNKMINKGTAVDNTILLKTKELLYYKNIPNNSIFAEVNWKYSYHVVDKRFDWNWEITDETKEILGYTCRKATSNLKDNNFVAWYTEDIPINAGPERFDGLPGLILHIETGNAEIIAYFIRFLDNPIPINQPVFKDKTYTFSELFDGSARKEKMKKTEKQKKKDFRLYKGKTIVIE